jgi:hypothetical protein
MWTRWSRIKRVLLALVGVLATLIIITSPLMKGSNHMHALLVDDDVDEVASYLSSGWFVDFTGKCHDDVHYAMRQIMLWGIVLFMVMPFVIVLFLVVWKMRRHSADGYGLVSEFKWLAFASLLIPIIVGITRALPYGLEANGLTVRSRRHDHHYCCHRWSLINRLCLGMSLLCSEACHSDSLSSGMEQPVCISISNKLSS